MTDLTIVIPWRDSGDPHRTAAFHYTRRHYLAADIGRVLVVGDGRAAGQPFNRHAAYNRGLEIAATDIVVWNEADTIIPAPQLEAAATLAAQAPGLVVPYTERHELDATQAAHVYGGADPFSMRGHIVYTGGSSIGQAGVTSRATIDAIGGQWPEMFEGWGYDDNAMIHIYATLAGPTRWVEGRGTHLWHLPAFKVHDPQRVQTTERNRVHYQRMRAMTPDRLRDYLTT